MAKTDSQVQRDVLRELSFDPLVEETEVGVAIDGGVVNLSGTVSSLAKRMAAQEAAHRVAGVLDVANDIKVKLPGDLVRTDTEIAQAVRRALEWDALVPHERIQSTVSNGWVTLEGNVETSIESESAVRAVQNLVGVHGVTDSITIHPAIPVQTESVREAIEDALERRAERAAQRIRIEVSGTGTVALTGQVRSWAEKRATLAAARFAPGVRSVEDHLEIVPWI